MTSRFSRGSKAYTKTGRAYTVVDVEDGVVYCSLPNGTETEFADATLMTEEEWSARSDVRRDVSYSLLRQARAYAGSPANVDRAAAAGLLVQAERLAPGLLDFVAFSTAERALAENKSSADLVSGLSIVKCREIFEDVIPEIRANVLADFLGLRIDTLMSAAKLGENSVRSMVEKGLAPHSDVFEVFLDRPRR
jgi:hypothetical protein